MGERIKKTANGFKWDQLIELPHSDCNLNPLAMEC